MQPLQIAVATRCFSLPLRQSIQAAADMGVSGVHFDARNELRPADFSATGRRQFLHQLDEFGLRVASLNFPTRRKFYDLDQLEARIGAVKAALEFAFQLKATVVTARIGRIPADKESREYQLLCDVLNDVARHSNRVGAMLAVTPSHDSAESLASLIGDVTDGPLGLNFDPAVFVMSELDPATAFRTLHNSVDHITVRDAICDVDGSGQEVPVGRGEVAWDEFLALLDEAGYRKWLTAERNAGDDKRSDVARAVQYLRTITMEH